MKAFGDRPIRNAWDRLSGLPGGKIAFSRLLGTLAPYTGTVGARFVEIRDGYGRCELPDRRAVRNHLDSVHAIALCNLGEMTTGAALLYSTPPKTRAILKRIEIDYLKKARGLLTAEASFVPPATNERAEMAITAEIKNTAGDVVARLTAHWVLGPERD